MSDGETIEEAVANGYSGKWQLRAPKSLHHRLPECAKREGVIPNTLAVTRRKGSTSARHMATEAPESESAEDASSLPEKIGPADLEALNQALAALFGELRFAHTVSPSEKHRRLGAVVALRAAWGFLMRFEPVLAEGLHVPLMNLHSGLLALDENNVEPILKPTKRTGRAASSPRRYALIGIAVGAAQRLEWTGLSAVDANKAVARKLNGLGVKPTRGKNGVTADTLRRWRDHINATQPLLRSLPQVLQSELSAEDLGWIIAGVNADSMMTEKSRAQIAGLAAADARRFVLLAFEKSIPEMMGADPPKPPS